MLLSVWVHLEPFRYCTKLGAKRARLVQLMKKFVLRSPVIIFRNESSRSTQMDPKLMFWCVLSVSVLLGLFRYYTKIRQTGAINVGVRATKLCHNFSQRKLMIYTNGP